METTGMTRRKFFRICFALFIIIVLYELIVLLFWEDKAPITNTKPTYFLETKNVYSRCMEMISDPNSENPTPIIEKNPEVIFIVHSKADDYESRCTIRATWSHYSSTKLSYIMSYVVYFQIGYKNNQTLVQNEHENRLYHDLFIHNNIKEVYSNLAPKVIASLERIQKSQITSLKYIAKTDDDTYVEIKKYLMHLKAILNVNVDYEGCLFHTMPVIRDKRHKNYEPPHADLKDIFPPYCSGVGYMLRSTKLDCLVSASKTHVNLKNGDANIGYLLKFCNATMKYNDDYSYKSIYNPNLANGIDLVRNRTSFYFMHGIRKYDQIILDEFLVRQNGY